MTIYQEDSKNATHKTAKLKYMFDLVVPHAETGAEVGDGDGVLSKASCADAPSNPLETRLVDNVAACAVILLARSFEVLPDTDTEYRTETLDEAL